MRKTIKTIISLFCAVIFTVCFSSRAFAAQIDSWNLHYVRSANSSDNIVIQHKSIDVPNYGIVTFYADHSSFSYNKSSDTSTPYVRITSDAFSDIILHSDSCSTARIFSNSYPTVNYTVEFVNYANCQSVYSAGQDFITIKLEGTCNLFDLFEKLKAQA